LETVLYVVAILGLTLSATQSFDFLEIVSRGISEFPDPRPSSGLWWGIGFQTFPGFRIFFGVLGLIFTAAHVFPAYVILEKNRQLIFFTFWLALLFGPAPTVQEFVLLAVSMIGESVSLSLDCSAEARRFTHCALGALWLLLPACWHWIGTNSGNFNFLLAPVIIIEVFFSLGIGAFIKSWK
jgi:hypothetical protein